MTRRHDFPRAPANRWHPLGTRGTFTRRPAEGQLVGLSHGVWCVETVGALEPALWNEEDERYFARCKDAEEWCSRGAYRVELRHVGGRNPLGVDGRGEPRTMGEIKVHCDHYRIWDVYPRGRWPMCSCCGEPVPCTADGQDDRVDYEMAVLDRHAAKMPGCCWACEEIVSSRQQSVTFSGGNLDLPGGPEVMFHTRRACRLTAERYEERWREADPGRPRILTWPQCGGTLIVHADGSNECFGGEDTCRGHESHNHACVMACYVQSHGCGRGCPAEGHPGTRPTPRENHGVRKHQAGRTP